jgi:small subunit ribosomal protein S10
MFIKLTSFSKESLQLFIKYFDILKKSKLNCDYAVISLPTKKKKICILKSPHVNKKSKVHYELRIYKKLLRVKCNYLNFKFFQYLFLNKPKSVNLSIVFNKKG